MITQRQQAKLVKSLEVRIARVSVAIAERQRLLADLRERLIVEQSVLDQMSPDPKAQRGRPKLTLEPQILSILNEKPGGAFAEEFYPRIEANWTTVYYCLREMCKSGIIYRELEPAPNGHKARRKYRYFRATSSAVQEY